MWPIIILLAWSLVQSLVSFYPTYLWFDNLGVTSVLWTNIFAQVLCAVGFALLAFLILALNYLVVQRLTAHLNQQRAALPNVQNFIKQIFGEAGEADENGYVNVTPKAGPMFHLDRWWWAGIVCLAIFMGLSAVTQWEVWLKALNAVAFGTADPIFGRDISFYLFQFPLQKFVQGFIMSALVFSLIGAVWFYLTRMAFSFKGFSFIFAKGVKAHLAVLLAGLALVLAWGLWLGEFNILYSARGVVFGAGYTDVKVQLLGYNLQIMLLVILAGLLIANIFQKDYKLPVVGLGAYLIIALVMGGIYPSIVQNFQVKPNEISMEAPYIKNSIKFTRLGYGLDKIEEQAFSANQNLSLGDVRRNPMTISNIRLWDPRPLLKTYRQLQGIRLYYDFSDVDIDRYNINGRYQQVMLSPREMRAEKLPDKAQTWINEHLKFTHGYGLCLSPVNEQTSEGMPYFMIKDIPPNGLTSLKISRPEIYYGEESKQYVIVNTTEEEFDYPKGDKNVYASYQGQGGVRLSSLARRLAFAVKYADLKILLTNYISSKSRIMFDRSIRQRVTKIAPFLSYDSDPYLVIGDTGRLFWVQDAYTLSNLFPYSDPSGAGFQQFNYIRNSIKVVIDAYNGNVTFYIVDGSDPLARTYAKIYPKLFKPFSAMSADLKQHLRYPYDLFMVQARKYAVFHMEDPQVFYNQEDLWNIPKEIYAGTEQKMDAYYTIMRLPGEKSEEFLLMLPFTPNTKDNMISWLAARSDMPNYGKLLVYKFPKDKLIYGPMQIEARIDQQTEISQQFTLWGQLGSRVIRGNLLAIPIEQSILYVEPIYLEAASGELPELKRVIVAFDKNVVMAETLGQALSSVFSGKVSTTGIRPAVETLQYLNPKELATKALGLFDQAQTKLKQGSFGEFGDKLQELKKVLQDLAK